MCVWVYSGLYEQIIKVDDGTGLQTQIKTNVNFVCRVERTTNKYKNK